MTTMSRNAFRSIFGPGWQAKGKSRARSGGKLPFADLCAGSECVTEYAELAVSLHAPS